MVKSTGTSQGVTSSARQVARLLTDTGHRVVFAESCTGGLVCGALAKIPGISAHLCGGVVVYRNETKVEYLGISRRLLEKPGPVSREVARQMALRVLQKTPEATIALSVTGHLGPAAPPALDGRVFVGIAKRDGAIHVEVLCCGKQETRTVRQRWVVQQALELLTNAMRSQNRT